MQDVQLLKDRGATPEKFKALFTAEKKSPKIKQLEELHASRIRRAVETNLNEAPIWGAIDRALEASKANLPYIQARQLAESGKTNEEIVKALEDLGLGRMLEVVEVDKEHSTQLADRKNPLLTFNKPLFDQVFVPLCAAYRDIRVAKLYNDRNQYPRYKYSPPRMTQKDLVISEIVTSRVQRMVQDMGYADDDKESIKNMANYGVCFNFPMESYYKHEYETTDNGQSKTKVLREGVRFAIPHPSRHFWDRSAPLYRFNSDTGPTYCGYWDISRWGEVKNNPLYWNLDKVTYGGYDLFTTAAWRIYQTFYPCVVTPPQAVRDVLNKDGWDRINNEQNNYLRDELDASVTLGVIFDRVTPKDWDLFDYDKPVWMRFIYSNYNTCIYAEVLPYTPGYVYLDRYDANKTVPDSLVLQLTPFQQLLGQFLTQHFMSVKQNLIRIAFVNTDIVPADQLSMFKKMKDKLFQGIQFPTFSKAKDKFLSEDKREAVTPLAMPQVNVNDIAANISLVFTALERMLGFSPQEVGAPASHEQSASEVHISNNNTSVSLEYMGTGIDAAWESKKRLLYTAFYCYGDDEVFAEVSNLTPDREAALKELGFEIEKGEGRRAGVKGKKAALTLDSFMSDREGVNRFDDTKLGIAMLQALGQVAQNQMVFQAIGAGQFIDLMNIVWKMIGMPSDFALRIDPAASQQAQQAQIVQALDQIKNGIVEQAVQIAGKQVQESVIAPVTQEFQQVVQQLQAMQQKDAQIEQAIQAMAPMLEALKPVAAQVVQEQQAQQAQMQAQQQAQQMAMQQAQMEQAAMSSPQIAVM